MVMYIWKIPPVTSDVNFKWFLQSQFVGKNSSISMVFCDAKINSIASGKIDASFSDITIGTC